MANKDASTAIVRRGTLGLFKRGFGVANPTQGFTLKTPASGDAFFIKDRSSTDDIIRMSFGGATDEGLLDLLKDNSVRIRFRANGPSYLTGGSFGIGTTSPSEYLEVNGGNAKITSSSNVYLSLDTTQTNGDEWHIFNAVSGTKSGLQFKDIDTGQLSMLLQEDGRVGFNTSSPSADVHFRQGPDNRVMIESNGPTLVFKEINSTNQNWALYHNAGALNIRTLADNFGSIVDRVTFLQSGNVGIGTTSPATPLHVNKATGGTDIRISASNYSAGTFGEIGIDSAALHLRAGGQNNGISILHSNRNVGIGTTSPSSPFQVTIPASQGLTDFGGVTFQETANRRGLSMGWDNSSGYFWFYSRDVGVASRGINLNNALYVKSLGGSVGIGTSAPDSKLEIAGGNYNSSLKIKGVSGNTGIQFEDSSGATDGYIYAAGDSIGILDSGTDWTIQCKNDDHIRFATNGGTEHMRIMSSGKVGIGTTAPAGLIHLKQLAADHYGEVIEASGNDAWIRMGHNGTYGAIHTTYNSSAGATPLILGNQNNMTTQLVLATNNNVGIGTATPDHTLEVQGSTTTRGFNLRGGGASGVHVFSATHGTGTDGSYFTITDLGKVGIGTAAPANNLHVKSLVSNGNTSLFIERNASTYGLLFTADHNGNSRLSAQGAVAAMTFEIGGSEKLRISNNGNVGIGTTTPGAKFHVTGAPGNSTYLSYLFNSATHSQAHGLNVQIASSGAAAYGLRVNTGGDTNALAVMGNGRVGIGTAAPETKLTIDQSADDNGLRIYGYDDVASRYAELFVNSAGYTVLDASTDRGLALKGHGIDFYVNSGGTHIGRWTYDGKLGVGTTSPSNLLSVEGSVSGDYLAEFKQGHSTAGQSYGVNITAGTNASDQGFRVANQAQSTLMEVRGDGEIRVAGQTLVDNANTNYKMTFPNLSGIAMGSAYTYANIYGSGGDLYLKANAYGANLGNNPSKIYLVTAGNSGSSAPDVVVKGGKVGIGNENPFFPLTVYGATGFNGEAKNNALLFDTASATTGTGGGLAFGGYSNGTGGDIYHFGNIQGIKENSTAGNYASAMLFSTRANGATPLVRMRITSSGRVGIGTSAPEALLNVHSATANANGIANIVQATATNNPTLVVEQTVSGGNANVNQGLVVKAVGTGDGSGNTFHVYRRDNSTTGLVAKGSGRVGIGITAPIEMLQVVGQLISTGSNSTGATSGAQRAIMDLSGFSATDYSARFGHFRGSTAAGAGQLRLYTDSVERVRINASGSVGIGTTAPSSKLHVNGSGAVHGQYLRISNGSTQTYELQPSIVGVTNNGFGIYDVTDSAYRLAIDTSGNVGIGTNMTSPTTKLHISYPAVGQSGSAVTALTTTTATNLGLKLSFTGGANSTGNIIGGISLGNSGEEYAGIYAMDAGSGAATDLGLFVGAASGITEAVHINSDGSVLFNGNVTATGNLTVNGTSTTIDTTNLVVEDPLILLARNQTGQTLDSGFIIERGSHNNAGFIWDESADEFACIQTTDTATTVGNVTIANYAGLKVGSITESSSITIKENVFDFTSPLEKISKVRPVKYNRKTSKDKKEIGLIAEELAEIFPELVENDENGNPTSVNYTRAVTVLFDGFKQMYKELKEIKEKIN